MSSAVTEGLHTQPSELLAQGYERYLRMSQGPARLILRDVITEVEEITNPTDQEPDATKIQLGASALHTTIEATKLDVYDDEPTDGKEQFIELFGSAMAAFYPDGVSYAERMELFDLSVQAREQVNGDRARNQAIYEARHDLIQRLVGKDKDESKHYQRVDVDNLFGLAIWLRGESPEAVRERGWSISPRKVFRQNVPLIRFSVERLDAASKGLAELVGAQQSKVLSDAARAITRFDAQEQLVRKQAATMKQMGTRGILRHAATRPDIMSFPINIIEDQEDEYVEMGFDLADVRADYKMYVYNPERIRARLDCFDKLVAVAVSELPEEEAAQVIAKTHQEILGKTQLVVNNSEKKIKKYTELLQEHSRLSDWQQALDTAHAQAKQAPRQAAINNLLRANFDELKETMEADPSQNIFLTAREIVNRKARQRYAEKTGK